LGKKTTISIPFSILENNFLMKAFLRGFFATDNCINSFMANKRSIYSRIELCNVSESLMKQIHQTLIHLGFRTSIWRTNKNHPKWNIAFYISKNGFSQMQKWHDKIGFITPKHERKYS